MNKTKLSVIVPTYNRATFLTETITSVIDSSYKQYEILIIDDGSTDNTPEVAEQLCKKHSCIRYIQQENTGVVTARNNGIKLAKGKYILLLDSDDLISKDYLEKAVDKLQSDDNIKIVYCKAQFFGDKTGEWKLKPFSHSTITRKNIIFISALFRKSDWQKVGGFSIEMGTAWEDWEFWLSILSQGGTAYQLPLTGFFYRIHSNSLRMSYSKEKKRNAIDFVNKKHKSYIQQYQHGPLLYSRSISKYYNIVYKIITFGMKKP